MSAIQVETLDGTWETVGVDRFPGAFPEDISPTWNTSGPDSLTFTVRRRTNIVHRDLLPFTPVQLIPRGATRPTWSGYTMQAPPGQTGATSVSCQGWQHYLDEVQAPMSWVHSRQAEWGDYSQIAEWVPGNSAEGANISNERGLKLSYPKGHVQALAQSVGATLDLGEGNAANQAIIEWESSANVPTGHMTLYVTGSLTPWWAHLPASLVHGSVAAVTVDTSTGGPIINLGTTVPSDKAYRYWSVFLWPLSSLTYSADMWLRVTRLLIGTSTDLDQTPQALQTEPTWSLLTADQALGDVLTYMLPKLSTSEARITPVTFKIPHFHFGTPTTAREIITKANAYHGYNVGVDVDRRLFFEPQPTTPTLQARTSLGEFQDQSTNDGSELYNHVVLTGQDGAGKPLIANHHAADFIGGYRNATTVGHPGAGVFFQPDAAITNSNPSFDTNTTGWTVSSGTITRNTGTFDTTPASGQWDTATASATLTSPAFTGTFLATKTYRLTVKIRVVSETSGWAPSFSFGLLGTEWVVLPTGGLATGTWHTFTIDWAPSTNRTGVQFRIERDAAISTVVLLVDSLIVESIAGDYQQPWLQSDGTVSSQETFTYDTVPTSFPIQSTSAPYSHPASNRVAAGYTTAFTGTFRAGTPYRLGLSTGFTITHNVATTGFTMRITTEFGNVIGMTSTPGSNYARYVSEHSIPAASGGTVTTVWNQSSDVTKRITWVPDRDYTAVGVRVTFELTDLSNTHSFIRGNVDSMTLEEGQPATLMDQRDRRRTFQLQVAAPTDQQTMRYLAQAFLLAHRTTPFKGTMTVASDQVVTTLDGQAVPPTDLGRYHGKMVRLLDVPNPDTGQRFRDAIITSVSGHESVQMAFDNTPKGLDSLLQRMAVTGGGE